MLPLPAMIAPFFYSLLQQKSVKKKKKLCPMTLIIFLSFLPQTTPNRHTKTYHSHMGSAIAKWSSHFSVPFWYDPSAASDLLGHLHFFETIPSESSRTLARSPSSFIYLPLVSPATSYYRTNKDQSLDLIPSTSRSHVTIMASLTTLKTVCVADSPSLVPGALMTPQLQTWSF